MLLGHWKNIEELENSLCLQEMQAILEANQRQEFQRQKFAAALKGVELPDPEAEGVTSFDDVKRRAEAKLRGTSEEQIAFSEVGILIEEDEEDEQPMEIPEMLVEEE